jgi:hypothetical protein
MMPNKSFRGCIALRYQRMPVSHHAFDHALKKIEKPRIRLIVIYTSLTAVPARAEGEAVCISHRLISLFFS